MSAGATAAGLASYETAVRLADRAEVHSLRVETRLVLAEALIHSLGGLDEEGVATLTEAERIALADGDRRPRRGRAPSWGTSTSCGHATTGRSAG